MKFNNQDFSKPEVRVADLTTRIKKMKTKIALKPSSLLNQQLEMMESSLEQWTGILEAK